MKWPCSPQEAKAAQEAWADYLQTNSERDADLGGGRRLTMRLIPPGTFKMGAPASEGDGDETEHEVTLTRPFWLGAKEVTRGQFRRFATAERYRTDAEADGEGGWGWDEDSAMIKPDRSFTWENVGFPQTDEHPVLNVSRNDAEAFCRWLSEVDGKVYRLPTEAEWEWACRAGAASVFSFGNDPEDLGKYGNLADATAQEKFPHWEWTIRARDGFVFTAPTGKYRPNPFGLYDMHGNVWEPCSDWGGSYPLGKVTDPQGPAEGKFRVTRGGCWDSPPQNTRSANRSYDPPGNRNSYLGFRVAAASLALD